MQIRFSLTVLILSCFFAAEVYSQSTGPSLFDSHSVLELKMKVDFKDLCRPRETPDCDYVPTELVYVEGDKQHVIPIEIRVRGGWRAMASNCNVPLLFIRFSGEGLEGTPFEGQSSLPLTTHCGRSAALQDYAGTGNYTSYEQYLLKEYLAYRLYNELTPMSLRVRLARIQYQNPDKSGYSKTNYAFLTEHFKSLAERSGTDLLQRGSFDHQVLDTHKADVVALFQFMIGNTDWSIVRQRNTILLQTEEGKQLPVPYDLDMSGLVDAPYAGPPPTLPIDDVKDRYYLGFCHPDVNWDALFQEFLARQDRLSAISGDIPGLYKRERKLAERYLGRFFKILNSPEKRQEKIIDACHPWPPNPVDHTTPPEKRP
jgi:hypothetical protein